VPFVRATLDTIERASPPDEAIDVFLPAEDRHGVRVL
jgi:hypothetical protein